MTLQFIVCFDDTPSAHKALELARHHADRWGAELLVVQALKRRDPLPHKQIAQIEADLAAKVGAQLAGIPHKTMLLTDDTERGEQIVEITNRIQPDQIFIGVERKSRVGKLLFSSTAQTVILQAPCPVVSTA